MKSNGVWCKFCYELIMNFCYFVNVIATEINQRQHKYNTGMNGCQQIQTQTQVKASFNKHCDISIRYLSYCQLFRQYHKLHIEYVHVKQTLPILQPYVTHIEHYEKHNKNGETDRLFEVMVQSA
jgi:hypothetical protein